MRLLLLLLAAGLAAPWGVAGLDNDLGRQPVLGMHTLLHADMCAMRGGGCTRTAMLVLHLRTPTTPLNV